MLAPASLESGPEFSVGERRTGDKTQCCCCYCTDFGLSEERIQLFKHIFVHNSHKICLKHADYTRANLLKYRIYCKVIDWAMVFTSAFESLFKKVTFFKTVYCVYIQHTSTANACFSDLYTV